jgi:hypothetical protein
MAVTGGQSSTTALKGSTEDEQFFDDHGKAVTHTEHHRIAAE